LNIGACVIVITACMREYGHSAPERRHFMAYRLSPPTQVVFIVSLVLVILALLARYTDVTIPVVSAHSFETLLLAFLLLLAGNLFRGF